MNVLAAAWAMGFFGSLHCIGMCGGIAGALSATGPASTGVGPLGRSLAYNAGRITSYAAAGTAAGAFGAGLAHVAGPNGLLALRGLAALLIVAAGLYLAGWSTAVLRIEALGRVLWQRLAPLRRRLGPTGAWPTVFAFGALWGWLPCGLVYSALAVAAASGSAGEGGLAMAAFGLGTLPAMIAVGVAADTGTTLLRRASTRRLAGILVMVFGIWTFAAAARVAFLTQGGEPTCHHTGNS